MKWKEVEERKLIPKGYIMHAWFVYKREHIGDYDFDNGEWKICKQDFLESEADEEYIAKYKVL